MTDVLVWDVIEGRWDIGHSRETADGPMWAVGHVADVDSLIEHNELWCGFAQVSHWSPMPPSMAGV